MKRLLQTAMCISMILMPFIHADAQTNNQTRSLVLYYSQTEATKAVAEELRSHLGADIERIIEEEPYNGTYQETIVRCQKEMKENTLPKLKALKADLSKYDTIYLGYPVWFGTLARPMLSYINEKTLNGKTVVPFCTFGSGGLNTTMETIKEKLPECKVLPGYGVRHARMASMPKEMSRFLIENGYMKGDITPLPPYSSQKPVTKKEKKIFDEACGDYQFPLGTPVTAGSRKTPDGIDYRYTVKSEGIDGKEATSTIFVTAYKGKKPEFTQVVR